MADRILVVEDEDRIRNIVLDYFAVHGLDCDLARDGEGALDLLRDNDYDAILLDVLMPNLDGFAVCRAVIRRSRGEGGGETLTCGAIALDVAGHTCTVAGKPVDLTRREYDLLLCLIRNKGQVLSRDQLLDKVWGIDFEGGERAVDVRIKSLRSALGRAGKQVKTVFKVGYRMEGE